MDVKITDAATRYSLRPPSVGNAEFATVIGRFGDLWVEIPIPAKAAATPSRHEADAAAIAEACLALAEALSAFARKLTP